MATTAQINKLGASIAAQVDAYEKSNSSMDMSVIRPHMSKGMAKGILEGLDLDPPWEAVTANNVTIADTAKLSDTWVNAGAGWAEAMVQKNTFTGIVSLRGYVKGATTNNTILTLPPRLRPAQNELFPTVIDYQPAYIWVWTDGTVGVWYREAITTDIVTLSGITFEAAN